MVKLALVIFGLAAAVQSAVLKTEDASLRRVVRCSTCGDIPPPLGPPSPPGLPPPPLPPPFLRTQNWSGLSRSADGLQNAVFSGAAAAADQGAQTAGQAFSLASSTVNDPGQVPSSGGSFGVKGGQSAGAENDVGGRYASKSFKESHYSQRGGGFGQHSDNYQGGLNSASSSAQSRYIGGHSGSNNAGGAGFGHSANGEDFESGQQIQTGGFDSGSAAQSGSHGLSGQGGFGGGFKASRRQESVQFESHGGYGGTAQGGSFSGHSNGNNADDDGFRHSASGKDFESSQQIQSGGFNSGSAAQSGAHSLSGQGGFGGGFKTSTPSHGGYGGSSSSAQGRSFGGNRGSSAAEANKFGFGSGHFNSGIGKSERFESQGKYDQSDVQQTQSGGFGAASAGAQSNAEGESRDSQASSLGTSGYQGGFGAHRSNSGSGHFSSGSQAIGSSQSGGSGYSDSQSALSGAFNLASQGLQTAQQPACSTCGKSSYALSNAKSHSGSAIALSIGG